ncbi:MAG: extracellular solute-binding protein [Clostridia bacterium]|nr:extracellular solute-binding protein [Clostridia bacterium]
MRKHITLLALLLALLTALPSCGSADTGETDAPAGETQPAAEDTTAAEDTADTIPYPDVTGVDLGGVNFNMFYFSNELNHGWSGIPTDLNPTETTGDILNDAVYQRNRAAEEMINIVITEEAAAAGYDQLGKALQTSVMASDNLYDLAFPNIVGVIGLADGGLLRDIYTLDVDIDAPWYDQKSVSEMTISDKLFYVESDITYIDKLATIVTYFNKSITTDHGMDDFYQVVKEGAWTYDYMLEMAEQVTEDVDGSGTMDDKDAYGIACQNDGSYYLLHAAGQKIGDKSENGLRFAAGDERCVTALQDIFDLMASDHYFNAHKYNYGMAQIADMYIEDRALFLIRPLQTVFNLREMTADFGIIPMPKYYEDDDSYHSPMNIYPGIIMCVPRNAANTDYIGTVIDLLAAESNKTVMPSFYDMVLDTKLTRDEMSAAMLDIIFETRVYDLGLIWDFGGFRTAIVTPNHIEVASTVASVTTAAETQIAELYQTISEIEG